jgi:hypothetical protein
MQDACVCAVLVSRESRGFVGLGCLKEWLRQLPTGRFQETYARLPAAMSFNMKCNNTNKMTFLNHPHPRSNFPVSTGREWLATGEETAIYNNRASASSTGRAREALRHTITQRDALRPNCESDRASE